jgi:hypothetical protein
MGQLMLQRWKVVESWVSGFLQLRGQRKPHQRQRLPYKKPTIDKAIARISKIIEAVTPQDCVLMDDLSPALYRDRLVATMWDIFQQHSLAQRYARAYPEDAGRHVIAAILLQLGVEHSSVENEDVARRTVAERIRKRLED